MTPNKKSCKQCHWTRLTISSLRTYHQSKNRFPDLPAVNLGISSLASIYSGIAPIGQQRKSEFPIWLPWKTGFENRTFLTGQYLKLNCSYWPTLIRGLFWLVTVRGKFLIRQDSNQGLRNFWGKTVTLAHTNGRPSGVSSITSDYNATSKLQWQHAASRHIILHTQWNTYSYIPVVKQNTVKLHDGNLCFPELQDSSR